MTQYVRRIYQCPECKNIFYMYNCSSSNAIDAKYYTDGYIEGPMFVKSPLIIECPLCWEIVWKDNLIMQNSRDSTKTLSINKKMPECSEVHIKDFKTLVCRKFWKSREQEKYIRTQAWHNHNHEYRGELFGLPIDIYLVIRPLKKQKDDENSMISTQYNNKQNMKRLLNLLSEDELLIKAELLRELSLFKDCSAIILENFDIRANKKARLIYDLALEGNSVVARFK